MGRGQRRVSVRGRVRWVVRCGRRARRDVVDASKSNAAYRSSSRHPTVWQSQSTRRRTSRIARDVPASHDVTDTNVSSVVSFSSGPILIEGALRYARVARRRTSDLARADTSSRSPDEVRRRRSIFRSRATARRRARGSLPSASWAVTGSPTAHSRPRWASSGWSRSLSCILRVRDASSIARAACLARPAWGTTVRPADTLFSFAVPTPRQESLTPSLPSTSQNGPSSVRVRVVR
jgi:hypothetical protein